MRKRNGRTGSRLGRENYMGWFFVAPFLIGFLLIYIKVLFLSVRFSLGDMTPTATGYELAWNNFSNYHEMLFVNADVLRTLVESSLSTFTQIPLILIFSLFAATMLNQRFRGRAAFRAIFFVPVILSTGVIQKLQYNDSMMSTLSSTGGFNTGVSADTTGALMSALDVQKLVSSIQFSPEVVNYAVSAANNIYNVVIQSGVQILLFLSALQAISPSIYESASIEGASGWEMFWKITLPILTPMILANTIYTLVDSFTNPTNALMMLIDELSFQQSRYGLGAAVSWSYCVIVGVFLLLVFLLFSRITRYQQKDRK